MDDEALKNLELLLKASSNDDDDDGKGKDNDVTPDIDVDDDKEDDKDYDPKYMKKYLKKYAKDNEDEFKSFCKDVGILKKAADDALSNITDNDHFDESDAVLIDGTDFFKAMVGIVKEQGELLKAMKEELKDVKSAVFESAVLQKAEGLAIVGLGNKLKTAADAPLPLKGKTTLEKAEQVNQPNLKNIEVVKKALMKAGEAGDTRALNAMTRVESCNGNLGLVGKQTLEYIQSLIDTK